MEQGSRTTWPRPSQRTAPGDLRGALPVVRAGREEVGRVALLHDALRTLADRLGAASASFGRFVRATALARGISEEREKLQALGESLIEEMGWPGFCRAVLDGAGWKPGSSLVIDGIRHVDAFETVLGVVAPLPTKLVFVDVPQDVRQVRAEGRPGEAVDLAKADAHSTEKDVRQALKARADLVLDGTREQRSLVDEVVGAFASEASRS